MQRRIKLPARLVVHNVKTKVQIEAENEVFIFALCYWRSLRLEMMESSYQGEIVVD